LLDDMRCHPAHRDEHVQEKQFVTAPNLFSMPPEPGRSAFILALIAFLSAFGSGCGCGSPRHTRAAPPTVNGPAWWNFGRDAQHSSVSAIATQDLNRVLWTTPVDLAPQYSGAELFIHYGSPVITSRNTVLVGVKTGPTDGFRIEARAGANGALVWSALSDYVLPVRSWNPSYNLTLTPANRVYAPGAGGKLLYRDDADSAAGTMQTAVFFGTASYNAAPATYDANVVINTPLVSDSAGTVYFGFTVSGATPAGLTGGIARLAADGSGGWIGAAAAAGDAAIVQMATNSAPALSGDGLTLYVAVNTAPNTPTPQSGYLLALDSSTLATQAKVQLLDPATAAPAWINDNSTASPAVGPDGDVYFGVLESNAPAHNFRGWLLHFNGALTQTRTPGSFGWDDTASIVPAAMVPGYAGASAYLLMSKYNNYGGAGTGDGKNRVAVLDPFDSAADAISGVPVMKEVLTQLGPTADPGYPGGVKEWCINVAAVDPMTRSVLVNSEDGYLYRWDLSTNLFSQKLQMNNGLAESYTPTAIGPDGAVYAINNAALFAVGR
jgi:hypothetical protein